MKKIGLIALVVILVLALAACGKKKTDDRQDTTIVPTTENSILPEIDPTLDTNIPDDTVNENSTDTTGITNPTTDAEPKRSMK